jgi:hypothetical protein
MSNKAKDLVGTVFSTEVRLIGIFSNKAFTGQIFLSVESYTM